MNIGSFIITNVPHQCRTLIKGETGCGVYSHSVVSSHSANPKLFSNEKLIKKIAKKHVYFKTMSSPIAKRTSINCHHSNVNKWRTLRHAEALSDYILLLLKETAAGTELQQASVGSRHEIVWKLLPAGLVQKIVWSLEQKQFQSM